MIALAESSDIHNIPHNIRKDPPEGSSPFQGTFKLSPRGFKRPDQISPKTCFLSALKDHLRIRPFIISTAPRRIPRFRSPLFRLNRAARVTTLRAESNFADAPPSKIPTCVPSRAFPHGSGVKIFAIDGYFTEKRNFPVKKRSKSATLRYRRAVRQARAREGRERGAREPRADVGVAASLAWFRPGSGWGQSVARIRAGTKPRVGRRRGVGRE